MKIFPNAPGAQGGSPRRVSGKRRTVFSTRSPMPRAGDMVVFIQTRRAEGLAALGGMADSPALRVLRPTSASKRPVATFPGNAPGDPPAHPGPVGEIFIAGCATDFCVDTDGALRCRPRFRCHVVKRCHTTRDARTSMAPTISSITTNLARVFAAPGRKIQAVTTVDCLRDLSRTDLTIDGDCRLGERGTRVSPAFPNDLRHGQGPAVVEGQGGEVALAHRTAVHRKLRSSVRYGTKDGPASCSLPAGGVKIRSQRILVGLRPHETAFLVSRPSVPNGAAIWIGVSTRLGRGLSGKTVAGRRPRRRPQRGGTTQTQFHEDAKDEVRTGSLENDARRKPLTYGLPGLQHRVSARALSSAAQQHADRLRRSRRHFWRCGTSCP